MNTETTVLAAIVLAIIIVAAVFAAVQGSILKSEGGVDNITERTDKESDGDYSFTSNQKQGYYDPSDKPLIQAEKKIEI